MITKLSLLAALLTINCYAMQDRQVSYVVEEYNKLTPQQKQLAQQAIKTQENSQADIIDVNGQNNFQADNDIKIDQLYCSSNYLLNNFDYNIDNQSEQDVNVINCIHALIFGDSKNKSQEILNDNVDLHNDFCFGLCQAIAWIEKLKPQKNQGTVEQIQKLFKYFLRAEATKDEAINWVKNNKEKCGGCPDEFLALIVAG